MSSQILYFIFRRLVIEVFVIVVWSHLPCHCCWVVWCKQEPVFVDCHDCHDSSRVYRRLSDSYPNWELTYYITYAIPYQHFWVDDFLLFPQVIDFMFVPSSKLLSLEPLSLAAGCVFLFLFFVRRSFMHSFVPAQVASKGTGATKNLQVGGFLGDDCATRVSMTTS